MGSQLTEGLSSFLVQLSTSEKSWVSHLRKVFEGSPVVSNVLFCFVLTLLEKLLELEFECPCDRRWNALFSSAFFIIPAVMALALMLIIQGCRCNEDCRGTFSPSSLISAFVWLILMFLEGQYFACAATDWNGRFVLLEGADPRKWCEPRDGGDALKEDLMLRTQQLFVISQVIGMALIMFICAILMVYLVMKSCRQDRTTPDHAVFTNVQSPHRTITP